MNYQRVCILQSSFETQHSFSNPKWDGLSPYNGNKWKTLKAIILLMCVPFLSGMANTAIDHQTIDFIKKNEALRLESYWDKNGYAICYGNRTFEGRKVVKGQTATKSQCEKSVYNHYFKWVKPYTPKGYTINQKVALNDLSYQYFHTILKKDNLEKYLKSYPSRKRWEKWSQNETSWIY